MKFLIIIFAIKNFIVSTSSGKEPLNKSNNIILNSKNIKYEKINLKTLNFNIPNIDFNPIPDKKNPFSHSTFPQNKYIKYEINHVLPINHLKISMPHQNINTNFPKLTLLELKPKTDLKQLHELTPQDYKMIQGEIFYKSGNMELALGIYLELLKEVTENKKFFILDRLSEISYQLDLYSDFKNWSLLLLENDKYKEKAYLRLTNKIKSYDINLVNHLKKYIKSYDLSLIKNSDQYLILLAQDFSQSDELKEAIELLKIIDKNSQLFSKAVLFQSILLYRLGNLEEGLNLLLNFIDKKEIEKWSFQEKNEAYLLAARLYFQKGDYHKAKSFYSKIDQSYIEWLPAQVEAAWSQILMKDFEGASGNMFSLHTDFFKNHFIPESYVARTIGYLGLCQYGDALKTTKDLKKKYKPLLEKTAKLKNEWSPENFYLLIHNAVKNPKSPEIMGVPREWIGYLTRDIGFIEEQKIINSLEDEITYYNQYIVRVINIEKNLLEKKKSILSKKEISEQDKADINWLNVKLYILKKSRKEILNLRSAGIERITHQKEIHKKNAGLKIKNRLVNAHKMLLDTFDKIDILQYEIFTQAGDQLRNILSGKEASQEKKSSDPERDPSSISWGFKGEIWKDEIGHYRSSLKNICTNKEDEL